MVILAILLVTSQMVSVFGGDKCVDGMTPITSKTITIEKLDAISCPRQPSNGDDAKSTQWKPCSKAISNPHRVGRIQEGNFGAKYTVVENGRNLGAGTGFTKKLEIYGMQVYGNTKVGSPLGGGPEGWGSAGRLKRKDLIEFTDAHMCWTARAIAESFGPKEDPKDCALQKILLSNFHAYKAVLPVPQWMPEDKWIHFAPPGSTVDALCYGESFHHGWNEGDDLKKCKKGFCDAKRSSVEDALEHINHLFIDIGLAKILPKEWDTDGQSKAYKIANSAKAKLFWKMNDDFPPGEPHVRHFVLVQEFHWILTALATDDPGNPGKGQSFLQSRYVDWLEPGDHVQIGVDNGRDFSIKNINDLKARWPEAYALYARTIKKVQTPVSAETLIALEEMW
eukprot:CAMPEP_0194287026 /NCGR_PEP_ID=MMETSP0169-20130528/33857_1 /TAXON_ID=218684 /ORGANISM="Corethron pennatum, Strain L29A3" /LENGTH=393 /DNA_ID=CAMNT_0039033603 /DNA_START=24 /DNA_END=1202 /DNA_ORIENTATION=+